MYQLPYLSHIFVSKTASCWKGISEMSTGRLYTHMCTSYREYSHTVHGCYNAVMLAGVWILFAYHRKYCYIIQHKYLLSNTILHCVEGHGIAPGHTCSLYGLTPSQADPFSPIFLIFFSCDIIGYVQCTSDSVHEKLLLLSLLEHALY